VNDQQEEKKQEKKKKSLKNAHRKFHNAMEIVFTYDRDKSFLPSPEQLVQFELIHKQISGYHAMSLIIIQEMRERAKRWVADEVEKLADGAHEERAEANPSP
jgi:hypothetical protein